MRVLNVVGRLLLTLGVLVLLFTAYQLWGTGLSEQHSQSVLRAELGRKLPKAAGTVARRLGAHPHHPATAGALVLAPTVAPPAPGQPIGEIDIPAIGLQQVVVEGVGTTDLRLGPGHYPGTPLPGEAGNVAIAGHRTTYAHPFYDLDAVVPGTSIVLTTTQGVFVYTAVSQQVVAPTDVSVIADTTTPMLTLTTCNPRYSAATRLVVHARLASSHLFASATTSPAAAAPHHSRPSSSSSGLAGAPGGSVPGAIAWGAGVLAAVVATLMAAARMPTRSWRWAVDGLGLLGTLAVLFFFFGAVSPLLPASL